MLCIEAKAITKPCTVWLQKSTSTLNNQLCISNMALIFMLWYLLETQHCGYLHIHLPPPTKKHRQIKETEYFGLFLLSEPPTLSYCNVTCYSHVVYTQLAAQHYPPPTKKKHWQIKATEYYVCFCYANHLHLVIVMLHVTYIWHTHNWWHNILATFTYILLLLQRKKHRQIQATDYFGLLA